MTISYSYSGRSPVLVLLLEVILDNARTFDLNPTEHVSSVIAISVEASTSTVALSTAKAEYEYEKG